MPGGHRSGCRCLGPADPGGHVAERRRRGETVTRAPPGARDAAGPGLRALAVAHGGELLGVLRLQERPGLPLAPVEERLFSCAGGPGWADAAAGWRAGRPGAAARASCSSGRDELKASRERLIETQDAETAAVGAGPARRRAAAPGGPDGQPAAGADARRSMLRNGRGRCSPGKADAATVAIETLASLSRGIYPSLLSDKGLVAALRSARGGQCDPGDRHGGRDGATPGHGRGRACTSAAWRRCRTPRSTPGAATWPCASATTRERSRLAVTDDGTGFDPAACRRPERAWRTCVTGWTPSAAPDGDVARGHGHHRHGVLVTVGRPDVRRRIAWAVFGLAVVATVLDTVFTAAHRSLLSEATWAEHGWPLAPLANLGCALMGALIVRAIPRHPLGWLLCVASLLVGDAGGRGVRHLGARRGRSAARTPGDTWRSGRRRCSAGRPSPRWCWSSSSHRTATCFRPGGAGRSGSRWPGSCCTPWGRCRRRPGDFVYGQRDSTRASPRHCSRSGWMLVAVGLIASAVSLVVRLRRSRDDVRRQLLWIASAAAMLAVGVVVILAVPRITGVEGTWLAGLPLRVAQVTVPALRGGRGAAPPASRDRPDHQPRLDRGPGDRAGGRRLRARRGHRRPRRWTAPTASGPRCSRPPSWRWPSSPCAAGWSGWPTGWRSAPRPHPTKHSRTSAAASARVPTPRAASVGGRGRGAGGHVPAGPRSCSTWTPVPT